MLMLQASKYNTDCHVQNYVRSLLNRVVKSANVEDIMGSKWEVPELQDVPADVASIVSFLVRGGAKAFGVFKQELVRRITNEDSEDRRQTAFMLFSVALACTPRTKFATLWMSLSADLASVSPPLVLPP